MMRVLVGRIQPDCNPNFREYQLCSPNGYDKDFRIFQCPKDLYSHVVVQSSKDIELVKVHKMEPQIEPDVTSEKEAMKRYKQRTQAHLKEIGAGITNIPVKAYPSELKVVGENAFPIVISDSNQIFMAGATVGAGRVAIINHLGYFQSPKEALPLMNNIALWTSNGKVSELSMGKTVDKNTASVKASELLVWNDARITFGSDKVNLLRQKIKEGAGLIMFINSQYYTHPIYRTEIWPLLLDSGIIPTRDFIKIAKETVMDVNWENTTQYESPTLQLPSMAKSISEFKDGMEKWLKSVPDVPGLFDRDLSVLLKNHRPYMEDVVVCEFKLTTDPDKMKMIRSFSKLFNSLLLSNLHYKAPGLFQYPGDFKQPTPIVNTTVRFVCDASWEALPSGYYLPPGGTLRARQLGTTKSWRIWVNYNFFRVTTHKKYYKWPIEFSGSKTWYEKGEIELFSAIGGLVWYECGYRNDDTRVEFDGVVPTPFYDLRDPDSVKAWPQRKEAPGPWATVAGDAVVFVLPSDAARKLDNLPYALALYDKCIKHQMHLGGENLVKISRELISSDAQIRAGYMHAGYPIGVFLTIVDPRCPYSLFNSTYTETTGQWGIFHELGHNRQNSMWNWYAVGESTNNIFAARCDQIITGRHPFAEKNSWLENEDWVNTRMKEYLLDENQKWGVGSWTTLMIYMQLQNSFGLDLYRQTFRKYLDYDEEMKSKLKSATDQVKLDTWFLNLANISGYNLSPTFDLWRVPVSQDAKSKVNHLPAYLPDDFMTQKVPAVIEKIANRYPGVERTTRNPIPKKVGPLTRDTSIIDGRKQVYIEKVTETGVKTGSMPSCWSRVK